MKRKGEAALCLISPRLARSRGPRHKQQALPTRSPSHRFISSPSFRFPLFAFFLSFSASPFDPLFPKQPTLVSSQRIVVHMSLCVRYAHRASQPQKCVNLFPRITFAPCTPLICMCVCVSAPRSASPQTERDTRHANHTLHSQTHTQHLAYKRQSAIIDQIASRSRIRRLFRSLATKTHSPRPRRSPFGHHATKVAFVSCVSTSAHVFRSTPLHSRLYS